MSDLLYKVAVALCWVFVAAVVLGGCVSMLIDDKEQQEQWRSGDCSYYQDYRINMMPARCVKEFMP